MIKWTKKLPEVDGFYYWRNPKIKGAYTVAVVRVKERLTSIIGCESVCKIDAVGGEWSDSPLEEPVEEEE